MNELNLIWMYKHLPVMVFLFCFGACVGSFLNVVIYRLPEGRSVLTPRSRCPICGADLKWYDNLPIVGWFLLRARCRYCRARISPQYMIIEVMMAIVFIALYTGLFLVHPDTPWWGEIGGWYGDPGGRWWYYQEITRAWPAYIALAFLIAGLVAMTIIDARSYIIPIEIPLFVTVTAFVAWLVQALLPVNRLAAEYWPIPVPDPAWSVAAIGGMIGIVVSTALLWTGRIRYSFADYEEYVKEGETLGEYPHARREMLREILFLLPCIIGLIAGWIVGGVVAEQELPAMVAGVLDAIGAASLGYLVGGGIIWGMRIVFSFIVGREAMGIGDVHLLAAVGAVLGWIDPLFIFFIAPIPGLIWWVLGRVGAFPWMKSTERREMPFGPHLAFMTIVVISCRPLFNAIIDAIMPPPL